MAASPSSPIGVQRQATADEWVVIDADSPPSEPLRQLDLEDDLRSDPASLPRQQQQQERRTSLRPAPPQDASVPNGGSPPGADNQHGVKSAEEGAKGSASSAARQPIVPPPAASVRLEDQLQPTADEGGASPVPSGSGPPPGDFVVPPALARGVPMLKVSAKKVQQRTFRLDADKGTLEWESKRGGKINIESIRELRFTDSARSFMQTFNLASSLSARWITIIYTCTAPNSLISSSPVSPPGFLASAGFLTTSSSTPKWKALHMVALSEDSFRDWSSALQGLWDARRELMAGIGGLGVGSGATGDAVEERRKAVWMKKQWREAEVAGEVRKGDSQRAQEREGWLDFDGVLRVCRRLNVASSRNDLRARFELADANHNGRLDFVEFQHFVRELKKRTDIEELYGRVKTGDLLSVQDFERFLVGVQKSPLSREDIYRIFARYSTSAQRSSQAADGLPPQLGPPLPRMMHPEGFNAFLLSADNSVSSDSSAEVSHDMRRPLAEFYVSSSHNTYLVGHQLVGDSTVEGYIRALLQGCRSVELDCWDGDSEPVIYHGRTLTSKISVREVLHAIGKYAFVASPYPVILSMEVHCCVEQQDMLAQIVQEVLGSTFLGAPLADFSSDDSLPSPEQLKYKILLKAKIPIISGQQADEVIDMSSTDTDSSSTNSVSSTLSPTSAVVPKPPKTPRFKFSPALAKLLVYTVGVKYRGFNKKEVYPASNMISLSERTANKLLKQGLNDVIKHNRTHLMRLYPNVTRLTSSNYDPTRYWACGAQLVAINWQSTDSGFALNGAMFARNGRSGYVLKPANLRFKNKEAQNAVESHALAIRVISGQQLPVLNKADKDSSMDTFVEVTLYFPDVLPGGSAPTVLSKSSVKARTRTVDDNGFNPVWDGSFVLPFTVAADMLDLIFVKFDVRCEGGLVDALDKSIGSYCISLGCLNRGYRHLPLLDSHLNQLLFTSIFVHTELR